MKRFYHYLRANEKSESLHNCIFVDTETDQIEMDKGYTGHKLRFGWAAQTRRCKAGKWSKPSWFRFTHHEAFWLWAMSHTRVGAKTWIWCINSSFDYPVLDAFNHLPDIGWKLKSAIIDAPPTIIKYRSDKKTLVLCDTLNIWRESLAKLGERIGLEKLTRPEKWGETENDDYYCRRDVEIILKSVTDWADFLRDNDMGGFCPTIAAQSMRSFRHRWLKTRILIDANDHSLDLARKCYHGGRCEAGFIGKRSGPIYYLDVNSMYPFVMSYAKMPVRLKAISRLVQVHDLPVLLERYCLCAHVRLNTQTPAFAVVHEGKLCFPVGRFDAYLTTPEIEYGLSIGAIEEVYLCASYDKEVAFRDFALDLYAYKETASRAGRDVEARHWKLLLNSFYGKWGQSGRHWLEVGKCDSHLFVRQRDINAQTSEKTHRRYFGGLIFERSKERESLNSHPAIAAHITAHARMILWTLIEKIPPAEYVYCDTDGVLTTAAGLDALRDRLDEHKLGGLKIAKTFREVLIHGAKDMILDGEQKIKGIRESAKSIDGKTYVQVKWSSLRGLLATGSLNMPLTVNVSKTLARTYTKGVVGATGFVSPLHFPLEDG